MKSLFIFSFFLLNCVMPSGHGLTLALKSLDRQLTEATLVADVAIAAVQSVPDAKHHAKFAAQAVVQAISSQERNALAPASVGDTITIRGLGGEINGVGLTLSGYPRPRTGQRYRAALTPNREGGYRIGGFDRGLIALDLRRAYSRNRTDGSNGAGDGPFLFWESEGINNYFPIPYFISAPSFRGHEDYIAAIDASFTTWRNPQDVTLEYVAMGCSQVTQDLNDGINNVILVTDTWNFDPDAVAITRNFYVSGNTAKAGLLLDTDILLNGVNHCFTTTNEEGCHDVQNIVTHEAGHFIGIGHEVEPYDTEATMYAVAGPNEFNKRVLHADDLEALHAAYGGVGTKNVPPVSLCHLPDKSYGCAAVHSASRRAPIGLLWGALYLGSVLLIGRLFWRGLSKSPKIGEPFRLGIARLRRLATRTGTAPRCHG